MLRSTSALISFLIRWCTAAATTAATGKNGELANLTCRTIEEVEIAAEDGVQTVQRDPQLAFSFLRRTGLTFSVGPIQPQGRSGRAGR